MMFSFMLYLCVLCERRYEVLTWTRSLEKPRWLERCMLGFGETWTLAPRIASASSSSTDNKPLDPSALWTGDPQAKPLPTLTSGLKKEITDKRWNQETRGEWGWQTAQRDIELGPVQFSAYLPWRNNLSLSSKPNRCLTIYFHLFSSWRLSLRHTDAPSN